MLHLETTSAHADIDLAAGGRLASFVVDGRELLVTSGPSTFDWGCYAMVPFAGRLRDGRFSYAGRTWQMPLNMPPHAMHGVVLDRTWREVDDRTIEVALGAPWPFAGRVVHHFDLQPGQLTFRLELHADEPMPAALGWHPWFVRRPPAAGADAPPSGDLELEFEPGAMYDRGSDGIPSGRLIPPTPPPWDDCFADIRGAPVLRWPGFLELTVASDLPAWVVYDEPVHAICVEPETDAPDSLNRSPDIVVPGRPLVAEMMWRWRRAPRTPG
jgi:galactose mutarotase-like enzyme